MAKITWLTDGGTLGAVNELDYLNISVYAYDEIDGLDRITYSKQLGDLPPGITLSSTGTLEGVPTINVGTAVFQKVFSFTIRAANAQGVSVDRAFSLTVKSLLASRIVWITPKGSLGELAEMEYFEIKLDAYDTGGHGLRYEVITGNIGNGLQLTRDGLLSGIPTIEYANKNVSYTQSFTVRVKNADGKVSDRTFSVTINRSLSLQIIPKNISLGEYLDGHYLDLTLTALNISPSAPLEWTVIDGELPLGAVLNLDGTLTGYLYPTVESQDLDALNWSKASWDVIPWDSSNALGQFKVSRFSVQVSDGARTDLTTYTITVLPKSALTVDNTNIWADNGVITADLANKHNPFITTLPTQLPTQRQNSNFAFKIDGIDLDGDDIRYGLVQSGNATYDEATVIGEEGSYDRDGYDQQDQSLQGIFSVAMTIINNVAYFDQGTGEDLIQYETLGFDAHIDRNNDGFLDNFHGGREIIGFDDDQYRHLSNGIILDPLTGWITGYLPLQTDVAKTYTFRIYCYKLDDPTYVSRSVEFKLTILSDLNNVIDWATPSDLGTLNNGRISELNIIASARLKNLDGSEKPLTYLLLPGIANPNNINPAVTYIRYTPTAFQRLPQGLKMLDDGTITGRPSFQHFTMDGGTTTFDKGNAQFDNVYTFTVLVTDATMIDIGNDIFGPLYTTPPNNVDGNGLEYFTAPWLQGKTVADFRTFTIRINNYNAKPYESLYIRALPNATRRISFAHVMADQSIFPDEYIYRRTDPWFGKAVEIKFLFASGLNPSSMTTYLESMQNNHYTKRIELGRIKTAVALDSNFNPLYEVVYVEVVDRGLSDGKSAPDTIRVPNYPRPGVTTIYPNSLNNLKSEVTQVGYANQEVMPKWMTSRQPSGTVLGMERAVVLAYTVPGKSKLIAFRLQQSGIKFNNLDFVIDSYQLDNYLSKNFDIDADAFIPSVETTFDRMPPVDNLHPYAGTVDFALTVPFDQINNRPVSYVTGHGGLDGSVVINDGQLVIFARQEAYSLPTELDFGYVKDPFDTNAFDTKGFNLNYTPDVYTSANDGWNDTDGLYDNQNWGMDLYGMETVIPGYYTQLLNGATNQRAGIWRVNIINGIVTLTFVKAVAATEYVQIANGRSHGGTKMYLDPVIQPGSSVPSYSVLTDRNYNSTEVTRFEGGGTRFYENRDEYVLPEVGNKFLKFPKTKMYN